MILKKKTTNKPKTQQDNRTKPPKPHNYESFIWEKDIMNFLLTLFNYNSTCFNFKCECFNGYQRETCRHFK